MNDDSVNKEKQVTKLVKEEKTRYLSLGKKLNGSPKKSNRAPSK